MRRHPDSEQIHERLRQSLPLAQPWEGTFYRATTIEYASRRHLVRGVGSRKLGGRWNPPGLFNAVYGSLEPETAMAEALGNYRQFGIPVSEAMPLVFVAVSVKLQHVLDLTAMEIQQVLGLSARTMCRTNWQRQQDAGREAVTQAVGRLAWSERLEAILVPSARRRGAQNIVLFPGRRLRGSSWKIQHARRLPRADE